MWLFPLNFNVCLECLAYFENLFHYSTLSIRRTPCFPKNFFVLKCMDHFPYLPSLALIDIFMASLRALQPIGQIYPFPPEDIHTGWNQEVWKCVFCYLVSWLSSSKMDFCCSFLLSSDESGGGTETSRKGERRAKNCTCNQTQKDHFRKSHQGFLF